MITTTYGELLYKRNARSRRQYRVHRAGHPGWAETRRSGSHRVLVKEIANESGLPTALTSAVLPWPESLRTAVTALDELRNLERTGWMKPLFPGSFTGYAHRPRQLPAEARDAGLHVLSVMGIESVAFLLPDLAQRVADPRALQVVLESARALEMVPELLGGSPHLLVIARRPE